MVLFMVEAVAVVAAETVVPVVLEDKVVLVVMVLILQVVRFSILTIEVEHRILVKIPVRVIKFCSLVDIIINIVIMLTVVDIVMETTILHKAVYITNNLET